MFVYARVCACVPPMNLSCHRRAELEAIERNKSDYSDLTQSGGVYRVDSGTRSVSRTSSVLDKYVESNGPARCVKYVSSSLNLVAMSRHMARDLRKCTFGAKNAKMSFVCQNVPWTFLIIF